MQGYEFARSIARETAHGIKSIKRAKIYFNVHKFSICRSLYFKSCQFVSHSNGFLIAILLYIHVQPVASNAIGTLLVVILSKINNLN